MNNTIELKKREGVNFDYILTISECNGNLMIKQIEIDRHNTLIDNLIDMYHNANYDVVDMDLYAKQKIIYIEQEFPFCLGHNYRDHYINDVTFPEYDVTTVRQNISNWNRQIENARKKGDDIRVRDLENKLIRYNQKKKQEYLQKALTFIYSLDYDHALKSNKIEEKYKIFSSEIHGRFSYNTDVNDDLKITTRTNFCYGSSSYFHIIVKYKDIELLPYSEWVKYYYARYNEIMRFTRSYPSHRESWHYVMAFLVRYINNALTDPDSFVKNEVMSEVNGLLSGLEEIFLLDENKFSKKLYVKYIEDDDIRYIGISSARHANESEREYYKITPNECAMIFRMEKITGALHFLKSLNKLSNIYKDVQTVINRILELNNFIYPDVNNAIPPIEQEIINLKRVLQPIERDYNYKSKQLNRLEELLERLISKSESSKRKEVETLFKKRNPKFEILLKETHNLWLKINKYQNRIDNREKIVNRLYSFKKLIENYTTNYNKISD